PTPTIQLYHSYTARLDSWGASHYSGSRGPELIINEWVPVGLRLQMVDAPATWRAILLNYSIVDFEIERRIALLERREQPLDQPMVDLGTESFDLDTRHHIPTFDGLVFAHIEMRPTLFGRLQGSLFRTPPVMLYLRHASGHDSYCRLIPATATNGILVNRFPRDFMGYRRVFAGELDDPVTHISIAGPGVRLFQPNASVSWKGLPLANSSAHAPASAR
ncbi:MAG: hypothetical protein GY906_35030, partial [bacterium]|nr:hypothetical protein [bacterium]